MLARFDALPGVGRPPESRRVARDVDDLARHVVWDGVPYVALAAVAPGATVEARVAVLFLAAGRFELGCAVESGGGRLYVCRRPLVVEAR